MKKTILAIATILPLMVAACGGPGGTSEPSVEQLLANAEAQVAAAKKSGFLWTTTEQRLENAKKAKAELNTELAVKEAKIAIRESQLALEQAKASEQAKPIYQ